MKIEVLLDENTTTLLLDLRKEFQIEFVERNSFDCEVFSKDKKSIIYYNPNNFTNASIAHELLHVWLKQFNYVIGNHLYLQCFEHLILKKIFSKRLCDYIGNCFDHLKMYPKYLEMGYSPELFLIDGLKEKCSIDDIRRLHLGVYNNYKSSSIDLFIGYLISILADHASNDYSTHIKLMKIKEPDLTLIIDNFWKNWVQFNIATIDPIYNSDLELVDNFIGEMKEWIKGKRIK
jgi:hypothetical protein